MIDQATRWLEIAIQADRQALTTAETLDREPRSQDFHGFRFATYDNGKEFIREEFQELLRSYAIKKKPISTTNPQANTICEVILNIIRCYENVDWKKAIYYAAFAVRASYHTILNASPGQVLFGQDMITRRLYDLPVQAAFDAILADNDRENDKRLEHFYQLGDQVMVRVPKQFRSKLRAVANGPYTIRHIRQNGSTTERLSIHRIFPR
ncbi:Pol Polyprotein [Phytophthora megakarya]|uniref:Pol Polyprotein n=1 Tax=Phytophthora megakarya TaxID=4795 RepID=A0A225W482_9STRA|nr:Pol Polyprotein [Phytophthora megakarya]